MAKGPEAFRTISEAADELGVAQHVLRFWESRFAFIRPMKRAGGRRFYRPRDIAVLAAVRRLLHDEGYTIKGVQKLHGARGHGLIAPAPVGGEVEEGAVAAAVPATLDRGSRHRLETTLAEIEAVKGRLDALLAARTA